MTPEEEQEELKLLRLASERGKFAIAVGYPSPQEQQDALERLQEREWIRLIDVSTINVDDKLRLYRVFLLSKDALAFLKRRSTN
jgi:hypothetical protein